MIIYKKAIFEFRICVTCCVTYKPKLRSEVLAINELLFQFNTLIFVSIQNFPVSATVATGTISFNFRKKTGAC